MHGTASLVVNQVREIKGLCNYALTGKGSVTMEEHAAGVKEEYYIQVLSSWQEPVASKASMTPPPPPQIYNFYKPPHANIE